MICTNGTGGILKEEANNRKSAGRATSIDTPSARPNPATESEPGTSPMKWVSLLQTRMTDCPTDTLTRCTLASLLEDLEQLEEALCHWNAVLLYDPNSLKAQAGEARCRQRIG